MIGEVEAQTPIKEIALNKRKLWQHYFSPNGEMSPVPLIQI